MTKDKDQSSTPLTNSKQATNSFKHTGVTTAHAFIPLSARAMRRIAKGKTNPDKAGTTKR